MSKCKLLLNRKLKITLKFKAISAVFGAQTILIITVVDVDYPIDVLRYQLILPYPRHKCPMTIREFSYCLPATKEKEKTNAYVRYCTVSLRLEDLKI